jgi:hypothetical protein
MLTKYLRGVDSRPSPFNGKRINAKAIVVDQDMAQRLHDFEMRRIQDIIDGSLTDMLPTDFSRLASLHTTLRIRNQSLPADQQIDIQGQTPVVAVVGPESVGKSNVLKRLIRFLLFPEGSSRVTAMVIEVNFVNSAEPELPLLEVLNVDLSDPSYDVRIVARQVITLDQEGQERVAQQMLAIQHATYGSGICLDKKLVITISGPNFPNLKVVDLPAVYEVEAAQTLVRTFIETHPEAIYLLVHDVNIGININPTWDYLEHRKV